MSKEIEGRVTKKLSQEFSRTKSRILGALSKLDEFLLNPQVRICSVTVLGTSRNSDSENRKTIGDRSLNNPYPRGEFSVRQASTSADSDGEETYQGIFVVMIEDRIRNAILPAIDNIVTPRIELAVRSLNASSVRDATSTAANSERGELIGITASFENVSGKNNTFPALSVNDKTRGNIPGEVSVLWVPKTHFDRQSYTHHKISPIQSMEHVLLFFSMLTLTCLPPELQIP